MAGVAYAIHPEKSPGLRPNAQIEGDLREGARTLLVEDLTTDARSKVIFCKGLRDAGAIVEHAFVVFHYGIYPNSAKTMAEIGVSLMNSRLGGTFYAWRREEITCPFRFGRG